MAEQHIGSLLPIKNKVIGVDESTAFLAHYDLNANDVLNGIEPIGNTQSPTWSLKPKEGRFGGGVTVEEGTTNLVASATVSSYATYHNVIRNGCNFRMNTLVANTYLTLQLGYTLEGKTLSISGYMKKNGVPFFPNSTPPSTYQPNGNVIKRYFNPDTGYFEFICKYTVNNNWVFHTNLTNSIGDVITIDNFQVEEKSFVTSFVEGTRPNLNLNYPLYKYQTISGWFKINTRNQAIAPQNGWQRIIGSYTDATKNHWYLSIVAGTNQTVRLINRNRTANQAEGLVDIATVNVSDGGFHFFAAVFDLQAKTMRLHIDDQYAETTYQEVTDTFPFELQIGKHMPSDLEQLNGMVDELRVDTVPRSLDEVMAWYYSNSPFWPKGIYKKAY